MYKRQTDLFTIAENAVDCLEIPAEEAGVSISLQGKSCPMHGIPETLYSIVYNLCENGIKYNHSGGYVHVHLEPTESEILLTVSDSGIGIPEDAQSRIFERFYRVDKSRSKEVGGTGLGLSLVKHGAALHHATISVSSEPEQGTEITLTFPAA